MLHTCEKGTSVEELAPPDWPVCMSVGVCSEFLIDVEGPSHYGLYYFLAGGLGLYKTAS